MARILRCVSPHLTRSFRCPPSLRVRETDHVTVRGFSLEPIVLLYIYIYIYYVCIVMLTPKEHNYMYGDAYYVPRA